MRGYASRPLFEGIALDDDPGWEFDGLFAVDRLEVVLLGEGYLLLRLLCGDDEILRVGSPFEGIISYRRDSGA